MFDVILRSFGSTGRFPIFPILRTLYLEKRDLRFGLEGTYPVLIVYEVFCLLS